MRSISIFLLAMLSGCGNITDLQDSISGLTNTTVIEAIILGVAGPESDDIPQDILDSFNEGTSLQALLVDADAVAAMNSADPVTGATVSVQGDPMGSVTASEIEGGLYTLEPGGGLDYAAGSRWTVSVMLPNESEAGTATLTLPQSASFSLSEGHTTGESLVLDLNGQGFTWVFVLVIDTVTGEVTYSNESEIADVGGLYEVTHGDDLVGMVEVPGVAFPQDSVYAVGVAGMVHQDDDSIDNLNTLLSGVIAGIMKIEPVSTLDLGGM